MSVHPIPLPCPAPGIVDQPSAVVEPKAAAELRAAFFRRPSHIKPCAAVDLGEAAADRDRAEADRELPADLADAAHEFREYALNALEAQRDTLAIELETSRRAHRRHEATLAHEVRTPLHAILGLTQGLLADPGAVDNETALDLRVIDEAAAQALELVNQQLALYTLDAGHAVVCLDDVSVPSLLSALQAMMEPLRTTASVELVVESAPDLPTLRTDAGKIAQILRNLVSNALRHTESGEVRVSAALADGGQLIEFVVRDTGPAVPGSKVTATAALKHAPATVGSSVTPPPSRRASRAASGRPRPLPDPDTGASTCSKSSKMRLRSSGRRPGPVSRTTNSISRPPSARAALIRTSPLSV